MLTKIYNSYCFIKRNFAWLIALIIGIFKVIKPFIRQKKTVDTLNSKPDNRKEEIGVADNNGLKQVETTAANAPKPNEVPVGVATETKATISGEGTLKPVEQPQQPGERTTKEVLEELSKLLNRNN